MDIQERITKLRKEVKRLAAEVLLLKKEATNVTGQSKRSALTDAHEAMIANVMLSYRHLEDAGMRLGKVVQAYDGGVSVYDK